MDDEVPEITDEEAEFMDADSECKYSVCIACDLKISSLNEARAHARNFGHTVVDYHDRGTIQ